MGKLTRRLRELLPLLGVAVLSALVAIGATHGVRFLEQAEQFVGDLRIATLIPPAPQDPDIVVAAINEDTLKLFPYRAPVDRQFLSNLLKAIDQREPRAIALDVLFDQATEPDKDAALKDTIAHLKAPIVISYTNNPEIVDDKQRAFLDGFVPPGDRVAAELAEDSLDIARWIRPGMTEHDGSYLVGLARGILAKLGIDTPPDQPEIVWRGRPDAATTPFKIFPSQLVPILPASWIKGKIVLIGGVESLIDRHRTPFSAFYSGHGGELPGIVIHAHSIWQLLNHVPARNPGEWSEVALVLTMTLLGATLGAFHLALPVRIAAGFLAFAALWAFGLGLFRLTGVSVVLISPSIALGVSQWSADMVMGRQLRRQREFIQSAFSRYVSPKVVEKLVADPEKLSLEGEAHEMSFLFTDLEGFTTLSERVDSRVLAQMLNAYLDGVCAVILSLDGMVDKFIGDAVFAIFNPFADQPNHAERAVRCALAIDGFSEKFRAEQREAGIALGVTRIGVHSGRAVIGNFGSHSRMQYTALGDTVNTASRLEGVNKYFGTRICVSEATRAQVPDIPFRPINVIVPKGKAEPLGIYEPLNEERAHSPFMMKYAEAYEFAEQQDPRALQLFEELRAEAPQDKCVEIHVERLNESAYGPMVMQDK
jgi:class 3 adenylate cyclase